MAVQIVVACFDVHYGNDLWPHIYPATGGIDVRLSLDAEGQVRRPPHDP